VTMYGRTYIRGRAYVAVLLCGAGCWCALADQVTMKTGYVIEGRVLDPEADPLVIEMPKGKIEVYKDMVESVVIGEGEAEVSGGDGEGVDGEMLGEGAEAAPLPVINLRPTLETDEAAAAYVTEVTAELARIVLRPEEAAVGEEALEQAYVEALGNVGERAVPMLREGLTSAPPRMGAHLLEALAKASPEEAQSAAKEVLRSHAYPKAREKAVSLVAAEKGPERDALLEQAAGDAVWYVRSAAYREMAKEENAQVLGKLGAGLTDEDEDVRAEVKRLLKERTGQEMEKPEELEAWVARQAPISATEVSSAQE